MSRLFGKSLILFFILLLVACSGAKTPQEAAREFWQAAIANNGDGAARYSTLTEAGQFDGFGKDWSGLTLELGKLVVEGDRATATTDLAGQGDKRSLITHLVQREGSWYVDYQRTQQAMQSGALGSLFGQLQQFGSELGQQLGLFADQFNDEMTRISGDLERLAEEAEQQAQQEAERYAEGLRGRIDELNGSIEQGLEEQQGNLSETQRQRLDNIIADLQRQKESLREPTMEAIAESSRAIGEAQRQLGKIGNQSLAPYQEQWEEWSRQFEAELQRLLNDLSARREA